MFVKSLLISVLAAAASAAPRAAPRGLGCLTIPPTMEQLAAHEEMAVAEAQAALTTSPAPRSDIYIDTYVHVVADTNASTSWYLSRDTVNEQMNVLNKYFLGTGFQYTLKGVDWTINAKWAHDRDEVAMKKALRKGDYKTLNLYYITDIGPNHTNTGHCRLPVPNATAYDISIDGCVMSGWTAPGGDDRLFSEGRITVHEVGHWHNLLHTFEGYTCDGNGDFVDDTPPESTPSSGCPVSRDTCIDTAGTDPIFNHMDYSDDDCRNEFTPGQIVRMKSSWTSYRA